MEASSGQHQEIPTNSLESVLVCSKTQQEKKPRPQPEQALKCPRCESTNTKFCYYNNYSLSQPRYFCKACRRYWTKGGTLRNVPVGGGCRKNKRSSSSSSAKRAQDQPIPNPLSSLQHLPYDSNDLTLAFSRLHKQSGGQLGFEGHDLSIFGSQHNTQCEIPGNSNNVNANSGLFDALRSGFLDSQNGFQNLYCGFDSGNLMDSNGGSAGVSGEMVVPYEDLTTSAATTVTTVKQEMCNFARESENRVLWGFPWQVNADGNMGDLASSWHGVLNSPLM